MMEMLVQVEPEKKQPGMFSCINHELVFVIIMMFKNV